jgi:hypothetical protein
MASARMEITITNGEGLKALARANNIAAQIRDDQPWNADAKLLVKALLKVSASMGVCAKCKLNERIDSLANRKEQECDPPS